MRLMAIDWQCAQAKRFITLALVGRGSDGGEDELHIPVVSVSSREKQRLAAAAEEGRYFIQRLPAFSSHAL